MKQRVSGLLRAMYHIEQIMIPVGLVVFTLWLLFFRDQNGKDSTGNEQCSADESLDIIVMAVVIFFAGGLLNIRRFFSLGFI